MGDVLNSKALVFDGVCKTFGETAALWQVSFTLGPGEIVAVTGGNGAGKSTLLRVAAFLLKPTSGSVFVFGQPRPTPEVKRRIGLLGHAPFLYEELSAEENLKFYAALYALGRGADDRIARVLREVGAEDFRHRPVRTLSHGMRKRVSLARAMLSDPDLLLFDEPFSGLDVASVERVRALMIEWRQRGKALLVTTHQVELLEGIADGELVLDRGRVLCWRAPVLRESAIPHSVTERA
ncbi:MAG: heme ABC exporter ATP-binding protein CcmA [Blastocatellia bacterium]|nr:heme ABC exporter ATP-binding protein CcmA [Blastocatellia bacterium]MCS7157425.1 heme ABC exporter ATP-binding protein CcmA [Blastocatellia bacterium]MCX7752599.1 heme ABC exporter ATP-binding protein CcmA [Blastocatellia bacterium]MDW8168330.1 heme ABC exporter ATP-binding protein CcmA [Acidobacteriota bacterium]MDW8255526.1 heme ABC exporter ATP-binding protein CcmA [Acidobacteriota bacterium]